MKFLAVLVFVVMAVANIRAEYTKEHLIAIGNECKEETGASDADLEAMMKDEPATTPEGKCLVACGLQKFGVMSDDGKIIKEKSIEVSKEFIKDEDKKELAEQIVEACDSLEISDDECEGGSQYIECITKEFKAKGVYITEE